MLFFFFISSVPCHHPSIHIIRYHTDCMMIGVDDINIYYQSQPRPGRGVSRKRFVISYIHVWHIVCHFQTFIQKKKKIIIMKTSIALIITHHRRLTWHTPVHLSIYYIDMYSLCATLSQSQSFIHSFIPLRRLSYLFPFPIILLSPHIHVHTLYHTKSNIVS